MLDNLALAELRRTLRGRLITPGDADDEVSQRVYHGMIDPPGRGGPTRAPSAGS